MQRHAGKLPVERGSMCRLPEEVQLRHLCGRVENKLNPYVSLQTIRKMQHAVFCIHYFSGTNPLHPCSDEVPVWLE